jgi:hypothetical protein
VEPPSGEGERVPWAWIVPLVLLTVPSALFLAGYQLWELQPGHGTFLFTYDLKPSVTGREIEAFAYLNGAAKDFPLVLSEPDAGLVLPAFAPVRALVGHVTAVDDRERKVQAAHAFFAADAFFAPAAADTVRASILTEYSIDYVWWGADEDRLGGIRPGDRPYLRLTFDNGAVRIYRVVR